MFSAEGSDASGFSGAREEIVETPFWMVSSGAFSTDPAVFGNPGSCDVTEREDNQEERIKVVDRRLFTADGDLRDPDAERVEESVEPDLGAESSTGEADPSSFRHRPVEEPEGVDFTLLINAMAQPVVMMLDEVPLEDPRENRSRLEQARLQIDLLDLLKVKCRGNLTVEEERLLDQVLYQLRMLFVQKSRSND
jgi:hypothetical protein